ncbi:MAG: TetR family transcriptional regulator [Acutalibacteraceae bacterium]|nr:TetR family transcriptional regulator [Acutalibacteraceae bacterium]
MIKQTFYNLADDKKQRITDAIIKELDEYSYDDISINRIVKNASISRGSFYQYFDDKSDLLKVILEGFSDELIENYKSYLIETGGEIFEACEKIFDFIIASSKSKNYSIAFKVVFSFTKTAEDLLKCDNEKQCKHKQLINETKLNINYDLLLKPDEKSIEYIYTILSCLLTRAWFEVFVIAREYEEVKFELLKFFELIKNGFYRR